MDSKAPTTKQVMAQIPALTEQTPHPTVDKEQKLRIRLRMQNLAQRKEINTSKRRRTPARVFFY